MLAALSLLGVTPISAKAADAVAEVDPYSAWWTGPLLSPYGHTVPAGHIVVEPYLIYAVPLKENSTRTFNPLIGASAGLTNTVDLQFIVQAAHQARGDVSSLQIGDTSVRLALQMLEDPHNDGWGMDLMFFIRETFPTGRSEQLDPKLNGVDASGSGAYTTSFGVNAQKVFLPTKLHPLRLRLNLTFQFPSSVPVRGMNSYGGDAQTVGDVYPGKGISTMVGAEYHLTQNWVAALDLGYAHGTPDAFVNGAGPDVSPAALAVGGPSRDRFTAAPAIEYAFNGDVGIVGGFSVDVGRNVTTTISPMLAVVVYH